MWFRRCLLRSRFRFRLLSRRLDSEHLAFPFFQPVSELGPAGIEELEWESQVVKPPVLSAGFSNKFSTRRWGSICFPGMARTAVRNWATFAQ